MREEDEWVFGEQEEALEGKVKTVADGGILGPAYLGGNWAISLFIFTHIAFHIASAILRPGLSLDRVPFGFRPFLPLVPVACTVGRLLR